jgi:hypothetical protein
MHGGFVEFVLGGSSPVRLRGAGYGKQRHIKK